MENDLNPVNPKMKIIFIAGPYFGEGSEHEIEENIRQAEKYQVLLANAGVGFFCPHNHTEHFERKAKASEKFYRALDLELLGRAADAIMVIEGWRDSVGTLGEIDWAEKNKLPIFFVKNEEDVNKIIDWAKKDGN